MLSKILVVVKQKVHFVSPWYNLSRMTGCKISSIDLSVSQPIHIDDELTRVAKAISVSFGTLRSSVSEVEVHRTEKRLYRCRPLVGPERIFNIRSGRTNFTANLMGVAWTVSKITEHLLFSWLRSVRVTLNEGLVTEAASVSNLIALWFYMFLRYHCRRTHTRAHTHTHARARSRIQYLASSVLTTSKSDNKMKSD